MSGTRGDTGSSWGDTEAQWRAPTASCPPAPAGRAASTWRAPPRARPRASGEHRNRPLPRAGPPKRPRAGRGWGSTRHESRPPGEKAPLTAAPHSPQATRAERGRGGPGGEHAGSTRRAGLGSPGSSAGPQQPSRRNQRRSPTAISLMANAAAAPYSRRGPRDPPNARARAGLAVRTR